MILITGGLGYIGPQLVHQLGLDEKFEEERIVIFDSLRGRFDFSNQPQKSYQIYKNLLNYYDNLELVVGDIRYNTNELHKYIDQADYVFHLAAVTGADYSDNNEKLYWEAIYNGTANVLQGVKDTYLDAFVNISSCNIYGRAEEEQLTEESDIVPINTYAKAKAAAEELVTDQASIHDLSAVSLRMATNFGNQDPAFGGTRDNLVINKFVKRALHGKALTPYGDGSNWRPFIHVRDAARFIAEIGKQDTDPGTVLNVGFEEMNYTINQITDHVKDTVERETEKTVDIEYKQERGSSPSYNVSFERLNDLVDSDPRLSLEAGIKQLINHYKGQTNA